MQFKSYIESTEGESEVTVCFDYQPAEKDTNTPESISITQVFCQEIDIFSTLTKEQIQIYECEAWNELAWIQEKNEGLQFDIWHSKHKKETV